jgi:hypothetical protein
MDVCQDANQYKEVVGLFKKMIARDIKGSKSSFAYIMRSAQKLKNPEIAIDLIKDFK